MNFSSLDFPVLHIFLKPSNLWRVTQSPTNLWYWDRLRHARALQIGILNAFQPSTWTALGHYPPDAKQSIVQNLEDHRGSALDEV